MIMECAVKHYSNYDKEPIEFMRECMSSEAYEGFLVGNVIKYVFRYKHKDGLNDLNKCLDYVQRLIQFRESQNIDENKS